MEESAPAECYPELSTMFATSQHAHFIGIGGIGMSGIAEILLNQKMKVSGSDLRRSPDHRPARPAGRRDL